MENKTVERSACAEKIVLARRAEGTPIRLVLDREKTPYAVCGDILRLAEELSGRLGAQVTCCDTCTSDGAARILVCCADEGTDAVLPMPLAEGEYAAAAEAGADGVTVWLLYRGGLARMAVIDRFLSECVDETCAAVSEGIFLCGRCTPDDVFIRTDIEALRDPFIVNADGTYYAYGTGWLGFRCSTGDLHGPWEPLGVVAEVPEDATDDHWAPEVHVYEGAYYMFTTYYSEKNRHRGCTVMRAESPEGPFVEISDGHITPHDRDSIDGTLYVDADGQPWMVYVDEWTATEDGVGRMAAARLSADLTHFVSDPIELFRADDPAWSHDNITDGCFLYRCEDGSLLMLWSNDDAAGYSVGIARSENGRVDGRWEQLPYMPYSKDLTNTLDGGHGMLFTDAVGQMYLSIHSPEHPDEEGRERPLFVPIREENGRLVWDVGKCGRGKANA